MEKKYTRINYTNEKFKNNIEYLIAKNNITKSALEKYLEMGDGSLSRYCKLDESAPEPKIGILNSLAKAFGVTIDDLINNNLEEKEILEVSQKKEFLFCNKLIENTRNNLCDWYVLNFYNDKFINSYYYEDGFMSNFLEDEDTFKSSFTESIYSLEDLSAFTTIINRDVQVVIIKYLKKIENSRLNRYELYMIKSDGKVLPSCASYTIDQSSFIPTDLIFDEGTHNLLESLYNSVYEYVTFGKDNYEKELIYTEYLNECEMPF